jgi:hypothetical protein
MLNTTAAARPQVRGVSMSHRTRLNKSQRAVIGAYILDGVWGYQPTRGAVARDLCISLPTLDKASALSPAARDAIMRQAGTLATFERSKQRQLAHLKIVDRVKSDDEMLAEIIARHGVDHVFDVMVTATKAAE